MPQTPNPPSLTLTPNPNSLTLPLTLSWHVKASHETKALREAVRAAERERDSAVQQLQLSEHREKEYQEQTKKERKEYQEQLQTLQVEAQEEGSQARVALARSEEAERALAEEGARLNKARESGSILQHEARLGQVRHTG